MSYARSDEQGKDTLFFVTQEDSEKYTGEAESKPISDEAESNSGGQEEAYNEETGEINWDCPCIAGMTKEPCGDKFKEAFSCFVYSKQEPKGSECIEQFKVMQECFAAHPDIYGNQDEEEEESESGAVDKKEESESGAVEDAEVEVAHNADASIGVSKDAVVEGKSN